MDNKQIKDGLGNVFTIRMRDFSQAQDGSAQRSMILATPYPLDYGAGGIFQYCAKSGVMAAMLPAASPIYSFRWPAPGMISLVRKIKLVPWTVTAFSPGLATFDLFVARNFVNGDSGGISANFTGESNQLRTSMASSAAAIECAGTGALTPGTRTLDLAPIESSNLAAPITDGTLFAADPILLLDKPEGDHPLYLAGSEGFVIQATVPQSNSTWQFTVTAEWAETQIY